MKPSEILQFKVSASIVNSLVFKEKETYLYFVQNLKRFYLGQYIVF